MLTKAQLGKMQKRGMAIGGGVQKIVGILVILVVMGALAPTIFTSLNATNLSDAPSWLSDNVGTFVAIGFLLLLLGAVGVYKYRSR